MDNLPERPANQRASDDDREEVAEDLRDAFSEGRLDHEEYERRLDALWQARTYGELDRLTSDLPQPIKRKEVAKEQARKQRELREYVGEWKSWLGGAVIMIGIWFVSGLSDGDWGNFWPAIPLGIWAAILIADGFSKDK